MAMQDLHELLAHDLGDLYFAEKTILKALKKMAREVANPEMKERLVAHQVETEEQIGRLEQAFAAIGRKAKAEKCPGILGIIQEHDEFASEEAPSKAVLEAFDVGSSLRVEHYEIAAYRGAIALAKTLGQREVVTLLRASLEQEVAMARFVERAATGALRAAGQAAADEQARAEGRAARGASKGASEGAGRGARKAAAAG